MAAGLILTILISNMFTVVRDGRKLDELRGSVLRLHILADSDSAEDQSVKIKVRDRLLESGIFSRCRTLEEAEELAAEKLPEIISISDEVLRENGCDYHAQGCITDMYFEERVYGDITMPAGNYRTLRITLGSAEGHNWWCVMYPPLCIPAACEVEDDKETEEEFFDDEENDILAKPEKYRVRFAIWDGFKELIGI